MLDANGVLVGTTPTPTMTAKVDEEVTFTLRKNGYRPLEIRGRMTPASMTEPMAFSGELQVFCPPQAGDAVGGSSGQSLSGGGRPPCQHGICDQGDLVAVCQGRQAGDQAVEILKLTQNGQPAEVVLAKADTADAFCGWLRAGGIRAGFLTEDHEVRPLRERSSSNPGLSERARRDGLRPFRVQGPPDRLWPAPPHQQSAGRRSLCEQACWSVPPMRRCWFRKSNPARWTSCWCWRVTNRSRKRSR